MIAIGLEQGTYCTSMEIIYAFPTVLFKTLGELQYNFFALNYIYGLFKLTKY
jgi:hypothetical protein